jgi:hypothetical protein
MLLLALVEKQQTRAIHQGHCWLCADIRRGIGFEHVYQARWERQVHRRQDVRISLEDKPIAPRQRQLSPRPVRHCPH